MYPTYTYIYIYTFNKVFHTYWPNDWKSYEGEHTSLLYFISDIIPKVGDVCETTFLAQCLTLKCCFWNFTVRICKVFYEEFQKILFVCPIYTIRLEVVCVLTSNFQNLCQYGTDESSHKWWDTVGMVHITVQSKTFEEKL